MINFKFTSILVDLHMFALEVKSKIKSFLNKRPIIWSSRSELGQKQTKNPTFMS